jgi:hypothetical protein
MRTLPTKIQRKRLSMSALDSFASFNKGLSAPSRDALSSLLMATHEELLHARSEDTRIRIVEDYFIEAKKHPATLKERTKEKL